MTSRALLIAGSHADAAVGTCAVITELAVPGEDPEEPTGLWWARLVARTGPGWTITAAAAGENDDPAEAIDLAARADAVFVDVPDSGLVSALRIGVPGKPLVSVDAGLVAAHGHRWRGPARIEFGFNDPPEVPPRRGAAIVLGAVLVVAVLLGAVGAIARWPRADGAAAPMLAAIGPAQLRIPAGWERTELSGERADDGRGQRAVFADPADGRRLIVVVTALRDGADRASVATSLANRIAQRGDAVVVEFAADATYGGRPVIAYRETPASGAALRWYIVVEPGMQISVGCQDGSGPEGIDEPCRAAVASVRAPIVRPSR